MFFQLTHSGFHLDPSFCDLSTLRNVHVDLRYATTNNFLRENIYGNFCQAFLHPLAFKKFQAASNLLTQEKPGWKFLIFDALRPRSSQYILFNKVKGTS